MKTQMGLWIKVTFMTTWQCLYCGIFSFSLSSQNSANISQKQESTQCILSLINEYIDSFYYVRYSPDSSKLNGKIHKWQFSGPQKPLSFFCSLPTFHPREYSLFVPSLSLWIYTQRLRRLHTAHFIGNGHTHSSGAKTPILKCVSLPFTRHIFPSPSSVSSPAWEKTLLSQQHLTQKAKYDFKRFSTFPRWFF